MSPKARSGWSWPRLGDSLLGEPIASALGLPRDTAREIAAAMLRTEIEARHPPPTSPRT